MLAGRNGRWSSRIAITWLAACYLSTPRRPPDVVLLIRLFIMQRRFPVTQPTPPIQLADLSTYRDLHMDILEQAVPAWLPATSAAKRAALSNVQPVIPAWYKSASAQDHLSAALYCADHPVVSGAHWGGKDVDRLAARGGPAQLRSRRTL